MTIYSSKIDLKSNIQIKTPLNRCCNCGTTTALSPVLTELKRSRFMLLAGTEITIKQELPYCPNCLKTAKRQPVGMVSKFLMAIIVFFPLLVSLAFMPDSIMNQIPTPIILLSFYLIACILVFWFYSLQKPIGEQTSYYQPIRLKKIKQKFSGEIIGYVLAFTNQQYQNDFIAANRDEINKTTIEIISA